MFVENYRLEDPPLGGGTGHTNEAIPYPAISDEDWKVWTAFLPVRTEIDEEFLTGARPLLYAQTLPPKVRYELKRANRFFRSGRSLGQARNRKRSHCGGLSRK